MATRIIEYGGALTAFPIVPARQKVVAQSAMTASSSSAASSAFNDATGLVCVQSDEAIKVAFGSSPTATDNDYKIAAGGEQWFDVKPGWKVAIKT
jgi:hypothetical protein